MAFKPSDKKKVETESTELNLLPVMNLIIVLIPLLLSVAKLSSMAMLEYLPPAEAAEAAEAGAPPSEGSGGNETTLNLLVNIAETGLQVSMYNKVEPGPHFFEIPIKGDGSYDFEALNSRLWQVKQSEVGSKLGVDSVMNEMTGKMESFPVYRVKDGREVSITAISKTPFQVVISAMDACRKYESDGKAEELFPVALLKQFQ